MTNAYKPIRLFETVVDDCPYLEGQKSSSILVDPEHKIDGKLFSQLSRSGFRRSGDMLYSPKCPSCNACISVRIPVKQFKASRSQKRVWRKNLDVTIKVEDVSFKQEHFDLYLKYQNARHPDSSMCDEDQSKYTTFIDSYFSNSKFICFYQEKRLLGISVIDQFDNGISAVYTYFDPDEQSRSLGTFAIMSMLKIAKMQDIPFVYLGYWIEESEKMNYKKKFKPLQGFIDRHWADLDF